jgi:hypothetical protein
MPGLRGLSHDRSGAKSGLRGSGEVATRLADRVLHYAERMTVRDLPTLQAAHNGLSGEPLAASLVHAAAKATGRICAAGGALASIEFAAPPALLGSPAQLVAETAAVVAVELRLVAELHVVYGVDVPGSPTQRAAAYAVAWTRRAGIGRMGPGGLSAAARRQLQQRLLRRLGRTSVTMAPLLTGAVAGALLGSRETRKLGERVSADLRHRARDQHGGRGVIDGEVVR